jgi:hypothetical protein
MGLFGNACAQAEGVARKLLMAPMAISKTESHRANLICWGIEMARIEKSEVDKWNSCKALTEYKPMRLLKLGVQDIPLYDSFWLAANQLISRFNAVSIMLIDHSCPSFRLCY